MKKCQHLNFQDSEIFYVSNFINRKKADEYFKILRKNVQWRQDDIRIFGKEYAQPRLTALFSTNGRSYSYSNITMQPHDFSSELIEIKKKVETHCDIEFTTCLLNLYRDGKDSNGWHSDDEKELGKNPVIASISLGQERYFHLRHKRVKSQKTKILLAHGSLLVMKGSTQHNWQHQIAKTVKPVAERINLTFRVIK